MHAGMMQVGLLPSSRLAPCGQLRDAKTLSGGARADQVQQQQVSAAMQQRPQQRRAHIALLAVKGALKPLGRVLADHALILKLLGQLHHDGLPNGCVCAGEAEAEANRQRPVI